MTNVLLPEIPEGLKVLRNAHGYNHYFTHLQMDKYGRDCANAAIEWYIAQQAASEWYAIKYDVSAQQTPVAGTSMEDMRRAGYQVAPKVQMPPEIARSATVALDEMPRPATDWHEAAKRVCLAVVKNGIGGRI